MHGMGIFFAFIFAVFAVVNGLFMLLSPKRFYSLPRWIRASGTWDTKTSSSGMGAIKVRLTGVALIVTIVYVAYDMFFGK